eukprot:g10795.t1
MVYPETPPTERLGSSDQHSTPPRDEDFESPRKPKRALAPRSPLSPSSPNKGMRPSGARPINNGSGSSRSDRRRSRSAPPSQRLPRQPTPSQTDIQPRKKKAKGACTKGGRGAWRQNHANRDPAVDEDGNVLSFDAHLKGLEHFGVPGLNFRAITQSVNAIRAAWNNNPSANGTFSTFSGDKGLSSQARLPPGGTRAALGRDGLRAILDAIEGARGSLVTSRFMPGDGKRFQTPHADGGRSEVSRMLISCDVSPEQPSASLDFTLRQDALQHPRQATLVPDPSTGKPRTRRFPKAHATCVIGDGVAFGRESGMLHEVVSTPAAPGPSEAGSLTILVDIAWAEAATRQERLERQKDLRQRLAAIQEAGPAALNYAFGLEIPAPGEVDQSSVSASNTAYNNAVETLATCKGAPVRRRARDAWRNGLTAEEWENPSTEEQAKKEQSRIDNNSRAGEKGVADLISRLWLFLLPSSEARNSSSSRRPGPIKPLAFMSERAAVRRSMTRPGSLRVGGAGGLALLRVVAVAGVVAASPGNKVSMEEAARSQLGRLRAQEKNEGFATHQVSIEDALNSQLSHFRAQLWNGEAHTAGTARVPGARSPSATGVERVEPAGTHVVPPEGVRAAPTSATGAHERLTTASERQALSMRVKEAKDGAGDLMGKAADQPPQKTVGTDYSAHDVTDPSSNGGRRRELQSCPDGSGVTVTSSEFPLLEGCLPEVAYADGAVEFISSTGAIFPLALEGQTSAVWTAWYGDTSSPLDLTWACLTVESASVAHPSEATWVCDVDGTFGVDCGCNGDGGSLPAPTPTPPTPTPPTPTTGGSCAEGSGITVTSSEFPLLEGCLEEIDSVDAYAGPEFVSETGLIVNFLPEGETTPIWFATYGDIAAADLEFGCVSEESTDVVHPSEATWLCAFTEDKLELATPTTFGVDCGSVGGDCAADSSLGVTSTAFPLLDGCLEEVVLNAGGELEYMSSTGLIIAIAPDETSTLEYWFAAYGDTAELAEIQTACISAEVASTVHPSEATWICLDAAGEVDEATGSQFVVECGCRTTSSSEMPAPAATTPPTAFPSAAARPIGGLTTPEPTPGPSATGRGLGSDAPTPSTGSDPIGVPDVIFPPAVTTPAPSETAIVADSCGATESFLIMSSVLPDVEGCYQSTDELFSNPGSFFEAWTVSGTSTTEQIGVIGFAEGGDVELPAYPYQLAFVSSDADSYIIYCFSSEEAITVHPADATWNCDLDGTESFAEVTDADVSFTCGCTDAGTPAPVRGATPITAPNSPPGSAPSAPTTATSGSDIARVPHSPSVTGATIVATAAAVALAIGG